MAIITNTKKPPAKIKGEFISDINIVCITAKLKINKSQNFGVEASSFNILRITFCRSIYLFFM